MAIASMKHVALVGMNADRARVLRKLQKLGCVEIVPGENAPAQDTENARLTDLADRLERLDWAIKKIAPFDPVKAGLLAERPVAGEDLIAAAQAARGETMEKVERLEALERRVGEIRAQDLKDESLTKRLLPWRALGAPFSALAGTKHVSFFLTFGAKQRVDAFCEKAKEIDPAPAVQIVSEYEGKTYALVAAARTAFDETESLARASGAERAAFDGLTDDPGAEIAKIQARRAEREREKAAIADEIRSMGRDVQTMRVLRDVEAMALDRQKAVVKLAATQNAFVLEGWIPAEMCETAEKAVARAAGDYAIEFRDPLDTEKPPTLLQNKKIVQPFEAVIEMFSLPDPRSMDATAIMTPFFVLFFGFMVSDAGYGLTLMLLAGLFIKLAKPRGTMGKIARIVFWGGLGTLIWGVLFGGWFGETWNPILFVPLNDPISTIILCVALGLIHVLTGVGVAAYMNIKRGKIWDAVWDQGMWFLILLGAPMLALPQTAAVGKWMAIAGLAGVLLFGARDKKNVAARLLGGAGKIYGVSSFLSDVLSYLRLFGMGLATGVIGMVFNLLAGIVMTGPIGWVFGIVILIAGHTFNLAINTLGAYVNACRLQYIEFFGHFYEQGGVPFKPLQYNTRYVDIDPQYDHD